MASEKEAEYLGLPWVALISVERRCRAATTTEKQCTRQAKYHYEGLTFVTDVCGIHIVSECLYASQEKDRFSRHLEAT